MSLQGTFGLVVSAAGITIQTTATRTAELGIEPVDMDLPPGKDVTDWVKTDANTAACNLPVGHGYTNGNFDVYWDGGVRYGVPGTIVTNALALDGGAGDDFPATATEDLVVSKQEVIDVTFDGDNLVLIAASATERLHLTFLDAGGATLHAVEIGAGEAWAWLSGTGATNPLAGNAVATVQASNGQSAGTSNLKLTGLQYAA